MPRRRLGEVLMEEGLIDQADLDEALRYKEKSGYRLGTALVALRIIAEWQLTEALSKALDMPLVDLTKERPTREALRLIPARLAERFDLIPLRLEGKGKGRSLQVAMSDPLNHSVIKRMQDLAGCEVTALLASLSAIQKAIRVHYHGGPSEPATDPDEAPLPPPGDPYAEAESTHEQTLTFLLAEAEDLGRAAAASESRKTAAPALTVAPAPQRTLALEIRFRALLHLMLKKGLVQGQEYAEALQHMLDALAKESPGPKRGAG
ncbi:MAG TPA: hypothetical protein PK668_17200 [Myxococcota bacterium]|nr:hypothetical protein [Myxococcota bacterium]HRY94897.1 hypothetical protein [Myxococcota bacterium]